MSSDFQACRCAKRLPSYVEKLAMGRLSYVSIALNRCSEAHADRARPLRQFGVVER
jgi:hypothetical protein